MSAARRQRSPLDRAGRGIFEIIKRRNINPQKFLSYRRRYKDGTEGVRVHRTADWRQLENCRFWHLVSSTDVVFVRRRRRMSLRQIHNKISVTMFGLVKPVINNGKGWSFIMKDQPKSVITFLLD
ncbi:hypothetical protein EVAR_25615_1 [Eumeta japonica]|uniref:Uncharacterized protein n=1 Tax=Eumeta variegata TaxID=151549 RepID=A0A4C1V1G2_EUMVA|nr:hypothetical protein EVAR_25615_1 [Eumeta japonica]